MRVLVTGASGFLGKALTSELIKQGHVVYGLSRHPPEVAHNLIPLRGDILELNLGIKPHEDPWGIKAVYHLAAIHKLGDDKNNFIWETNVTGTQNVIDFCFSHKVPHLYFCSTAYTTGEGRNSYERSKILCDKMVRSSQIPKITIFKPSIVLGSKENPYPGHFSQFISLVIKVHQRAELVRRKIEGTLRLPVIEPLFRVKGDPNRCLNLVTVDAVVDAMARIRNTGTFWLTNPKPPKLGDLVEWAGEFVLLNMKILPHFKPTPIEVMFQKLSSAFDPYVWGDNFPSSIKAHPIITKEFIHQVLTNSLTIDKEKQKIYTKGIGNQGGKLE